MPVYHSSFDSAEFQQVGNMALLPIKSKTRGIVPAPADPQADDIIDEALNLYRANCFFRNFEIKSPADRVLIYLILFIGDCLSKLSRGSTASVLATPQQEAFKVLNTHALNSFSVPGEPGFPLNALYAPPANRNDADAMRSYIGQLRQELVVRLVERIYAPDGRLSKWWMAFAKKKFMGKNL
ncbi:subunit of the Arp2/3 complex [Sorochytrium milnesiophthora]